VSFDEATYLFPLEIEQIFYYNQGMSWIKQISGWLNPASHTHLLLLELDPLQAVYLAQIAARSRTSRQQAAQDLLNNALVDCQISEAHLAHWRALTPRQQQVAALACLNFTNRQIAARLGISPQTVKAHLRNLLDRFELHGKVELRQALEDWDFSEWV
jgi:DNA-binding CsgD family transcriptional regulator